MLPGATVTSWPQLLLRAMSVLMSEALVTIKSHADVGGLGCYLWPRDVQGPHCCWGLADLGGLHCHRDNGDIQTVAEDHVGACDPTGAGVACVATKGHNDVWVENCGFVGV